jgi:hypothetical protein
MYKRIDFSKLEGLATYQDTLDFLQISYRDAISAVARAFGDKVIVTGIDDQGASYGDGWVVIAGELMPFAGGLKTNQVIVEEITDTEVFGDNSVQTVYFTKRAKLGVIGGYAFTDFIRVDTMVAISEGLKNLVIAHNNLQLAFDTHTHSWNQITGKPTTFPPSPHTHPWDQVTGKPAIPTYTSGTYNIGDVVGDDNWYTVGIADQGDTNYYVVGTLVSQGADWNKDNDVFWMVRNKQPSYFQLLVRDIGAESKNLRFEYLIIKF